ncbi:unnamed protein product [Trichobilharzia regenti]|uniref:Secreted protein n=1 Tax=Trichobilharzia regenti TaxID=157069 RepID=A0A183VRI9_TRIRE|nr:unnamed protein product [Trichobilharzia regenti]VDP98975.1 unnamed protein product [Trichobilharzia regenti]
MYMSKSVLLILSFYIHAVYSQSESQCNLENMQDCCTAEAKLNAKRYTQTDTQGADFQQLMNYYRDLCQYQTLNEQAAYIQQQYDKLSNVNLKEMFTTTTRRPLVKATPKPMMAPSKPRRP